eukprot:8149932-Heterocapsa_arctica.AAC.1
MPHSWALASKSRIHSEISMHCLPGSKPNRQATGGDEEERARAVTQARYHLSRAATREIGRSWVRL